MMKESLEDYTRMMRERYVRPWGRKARGVLLDEYCQSSGLERKYAIKVLRGQRRREPGGKVLGTPLRYGAQDIAVLKSVWLASGQPCGKRFAGEMLGLWLGSWQKHHGALRVGQSERLEQISAAQIDRVLGPYRTAGRRRRIASSGLAAMQREVAVRCEPWAETGPGALEIDTVALCGGSMSGAIIWALDATDIHSGWTEVRAVWNRGAYATCERLREVEAALPFRVRKLDFDNGTEFLNGHFISYFKGREPRIELSRSRPYRKNDNAHIEQKNYTHVRLLLGDDRFEDESLVEPLNEALREWSLWNNLYGAQRRLLRKERGADGKVKRHHEKAASTPCTRLLGREDMEPQRARQLRELLAQHDPIEMKGRIESKLKAVYELRAKLQEEEQSQEPTITPPRADRAADGGPALRSLGRLRLPALPTLWPTIHSAQHTDKQALPRRPSATKSKVSTVSFAVRHRAAS